MLFPQLHTVIIQSPMRNGSAPKETVLLRLHLCSHFVSAQQAGLHNSDGGTEVTFSGVKNQRLGVWSWKRDNVPCVLNTFKPLQPKQLNPTAYQCCAYNFVMVHVCCFSLAEKWFRLQDSSFVQFIFVWWLTITAVLFCSSQPNVMAFLWFMCDSMPVLVVILFVFLISLLTLNTHTYLFFAYFKQITVIFSRHIKSFHSLCIKIFFPAKTFFIKPNVLLS